MVSITIRVNLTEKQLARLMKAVLWIAVWFLT